MSSETSRYRSWVEVSRQTLTRNFRAVRDLCGSNIEVMPVVKADAYRHGAVEVSKVLEQAGAKWLAVSNAEEGLALREAGIQSRIVVMADFAAEWREDMLRGGLTPVLNSRTEIEDLAQLASSLGGVCGYHLKIDSGMGRLGTRATAAQIAETVLANQFGAKLEGLMTHFASSANYASPQTDEQTAYFLSLCEGLAALGIRPPYIHTSSTIPIAYGRRSAWGNLVRPGEAIYGYVSPPRGSAPGAELTVKPALTWKARVLLVKDIPEGAQVGYGGIFRSPKPMRIAVIGAGYADGVPHRLSNKGKVIFDGKLLPMLGAVSMDVTTIDATPCPKMRAGDAVTLLGREGDASMDAQEIAKLAGTISYSVLCGISARVKRVYV
ncbi:MAG: alanine racemase [Bryobacteraceae bacterium]